MTAEPAPGLTAYGTLNQIERLFLVPRRGPSQGAVRRLALPNMPQDLRDQRWVLDTGHHPQRAAAMGTGLGIVSLPVRTLLRHDLQSDVVGAVDHRELSSGYDGRAVDRGENIGN